MAEELPEGVIARIDVTETGVRVGLREAVSREEFVGLLRVLADAYEQGTIQRVE